MHIASEKRYDTMSYNRIGISGLTVAVFLANRKEFMYKVKYARKQIVQNGQWLNVTARLLMGSSVERWRLLARGIGQNSNTLPLFL